MYPFLKTLLPRDRNKTLWFSHISPKTLGCSVD